jgi:hypothetical protein
MHNVRREVGPLGTCMGASNSKFGETEDDSLISRTRISISSGTGIRVSATNNTYAHEHHILRFIV